MPYADTYRTDAPEPDDIQSWTGPAVLEFGANWCGFCQGAQPAIREAMEDFPDLLHVKVEDGPGRRLGRSFKVRLWPTLIILRDGREVSRLVRSDDPDEIRQAISAATGDE